MLTITNEDNMVLMARYPDKYFDLAIVDPPYGIGKLRLIGPNKIPRTASGKMYIKNTNWDTKPLPSYFTELFRVSKNQIIWGGNYFTDMLPVSRGWVYWNKKNYVESYSDGELAWTSFDKPLKSFTIQYNGFLKPKEVYIHPTQKPIKLYKHILNKFCKKGDKILDTHLGSGSSALASLELGYDFTACELDKDMFNKSNDRIKNHVHQIELL